MLIKGAMIAVDIIYSEKLKKNQSNQAARVLCSSVICCAAPPVHAAYRDSGSSQTLRNSTNCLMSNGSTSH